MPRRNIYVLLFALLVSLICYQKTDSASRSRYGRYFEPFRQVIDQIERNYVEEVDARSVFDAGLEGMVEALGDPYSKYFPPQEYPHLREELAQEFGGIGINVTFDEERKLLKIAGPLPGTPAHEANLCPGDLILEVDGVSIQGKTMEEATALIKGRPGTVVRLKVLPDGQTQPKDYEITRAEIHVPSVMGDHYTDKGVWDFWLDGQPGIAYVRLAKFSDKTTEELKAAVNSLQQQGVKGLVLDLRNNPGGLLQAAVDICDLFVQEGTIVSIRGRQGREVYSAHAGGTFSGFPMAVLINRYSASASEIVSACLQDHQRAVVVGERSWGKGSVQSVVELENRRSALKLTIATYWRPSGKNIHKLPSAEDKDDWGVRPNPGMEVKVEGEAMTTLLKHRHERDVFRRNGSPIPPLNLDLDPQLKKAVEVLKETIVAQNGAKTPA
jgi:carboxyl-terminal processing protease